jgi:hypothetical protein
MKKKIDKKQTVKKEETLLTFLKMTKEGKYARIEQTAVPSSRSEMLREEPYFEEEEVYYYSTT